MFHEKTCTFFGKEVDNQRDVLYGIIYGVLRCEPSALWTLSLGEVEGFVGVRE
jgi:hypothetical protein